MESENYSVYSNQQTRRLFLYQKTLDNHRRKLLAQNLLKKIQLPISLTEDYLYEILTTTFDNQLLTIIELINKNLPFFKADFDEDEELTITQL